MLSGKSIFAVVLLGFVALGCSQNTTNPTKNLARPANGEPATGLKTCSTPSLAKSSAQSKPLTGLSEAVVATLPAGQYALLKVVSSVQPDTKSRSSISVNVDLAEAFKDGIKEDEITAKNAFNLMKKEVSCDKFEAKSTEAAALIGAPLVFELPSGQSTLYWALDYSVQESDDSSDVFHPSVSVVTESLQKWASHFNTKPNTKAEVRTTKVSESAFEVLVTETIKPKTGPTQKVTTSYFFQRLAEKNAASILEVPPSAP